jgi:hypothetical protein
LPGLSRRATSTAVRLVGPDVEFEPVGVVERLSFELVILGADRDRRVFRTLVKGAQSLP